MAHVSPHIDTVGWTATVDPATGQRAYSPCPECGGPVTGVSSQVWHARTSPGHYEPAGNKHTFEPCGHSVNDSHTPTYRA